MREDNSHQVTGEAPADVGSVTVPTEEWLELLHQLDCWKSDFRSSQSHCRALSQEIMDLKLVVSGFKMTLAKHGLLTGHGKVTEPTGTSAGGSLEDDLTSSSEISRLKQALEEIANLPVGGNPVGFYTAAQNMKATAREALTSTPLEKTDGK